jgi:hypothetical protein
MSYREQAFLVHFTDPGGIGVALISITVAFILIPSDDHHADFSRWLAIAAGFI